MDNNIKQNRIIFMVALVISFLSVFLFFAPILNETSILMFDALKPISFIYKDVTYTIVYTYPMKVLIVIQTLIMLIDILAFIFVVIDKDSIKRVLLTSIPIIILSLVCAGISFAIDTLLGLPFNVFRLGAGPIIYGSLSLLPIFFLECGALFNAIKMTRTTSRAIKEYADKIEQEAISGHENLTKEEKYTVIARLSKLKEEGILSEKDFKERISRLL